MNLTTPHEPHSQNRWWRPFDIEWLRDHPLFVGFMELDPEPGFVSCSIEVVYPYKTNLTNIMTERGKRFAPYRGTFISAVVDNEPGRILRFYFGEEL